MRACVEYLKKNTKEPLDIAEIGVHCGNNAQEILNELNVKRLYLIDPYVAYVDRDSSCREWFLYDSILVDKFRMLAENNLAMHKSADRIKFIRLPSSQAVELFPLECFDFVYIDASHSRPNVDNDINLWYSRVKKGGMLGGHDWCIKDVQDAVHLFAEEQKIKLQEEEFKTDWFIIK